MANILEKYGIKEVADVTFYKLDDNGIPMYPVLYLDTLKVSTIEQTAETTDARGGKGNAKLISWDYNKEINVTLEDALFSAKSLAIMFGNGNPVDIKSTDSTGVKANDNYIMKTEQFVASDTKLPTGSADESGWKMYYIAPDGKKYKKLNPKFYANNISETKRKNASGQDIQIELTGNLTVGETYFCTYDLAMEGFVIDVSANSFPGTYYITGDTFARSNNSGDDKFFQFIIPKAKVTSENTITLEAEGDPSVFNMSLTVLRPADGVMMKLVQYNLVNGETVTAENTSTLYHNHYLAQSEATPAG